MQQLIFHAPEETHEWGQKFAQSLSGGSVVAFFGALAAGKTTLIQSIVSQIFSGKQIASPTFVYLNEYQNVDQSFFVYHFDLYRLQGGCQEFIECGFEEYLYQKQSICLIEWAERIEELLPSHCYKIYLEHCREGGRRLSLAYQ